MAIVCASPWRFPTPTGSGCRTSASRPSTASSTRRRHRLRALLPAAEAGARRAVGGEDAAAHARVPDSGQRLRHRRLLGVVRVGLRQRAHAAAPGRHSALRRGAVAAPSADGRRRRGDVRESRAAGAVRRRDRRGRGRSAGARPAPRRRRRDRTARPAAPARRANAASTSRRSTNPVRRRRHAGRHTGARRRRRAAAGAQGGAQGDRRGRSAGDQHLHARHRVRLALPRSRSSAAARTCAASAGPATTTCRSAPFPPTASSSCRARRACTRAASAWCRSRSAIIRRSSASWRNLLEMGYAISPASLRLDDLTRVDRPGAARRAASGGSPSRRKPARIACAASSTRP